MKTILRYSLITTCLLIVPFWGFGQIVESPFGDEVFLKGDYVEVGIARCGSFGSILDAPAGYHPRGAGNALGFVCDSDKDGWAQYCGDYFLPGQPEEGFGVKINGTSYGNYARCEQQQLSGGIIDYQDTPEGVEATWQGGNPGLLITSRTFFPKDALYFVTQVTLTNPSSSSTRENVFYMRTLDPDNDQPTCGSFNTRNEVVFQQPAAADCKALVTAVGVGGGCVGCFLGLGTKDDRARVTHGGLGSPLQVRDPEAVWNAGEAQTSNCSPSALAGTGACTFDAAMSISFKLGDIPPSESRTVTFVYVLDEADLDAALDATIDVDFFANGIDITEEGEATRCGENEVTLKIEGGDGYDWTWSPATYLNTTTSSEVIATPEEPITYTITGVSSTSPCLPPITSTISLDLEPEPDIRLNIEFEEGYCADEAAFTIDANPVGGTLLINDTPGSVINPAALGVGTHNVKYIYTNTFSGCEYIFEDDFEVRAVTEVEIINLADEYCANDPSFALEADVEGGVFRINGNIQTNLDPSALGAGTHNITYTYLNAQNCESQDSKTISIPALPTLNIDLNDAYCLNAEAQTLTAEPSGGSFTINGVSATEFDPSALGVGNHLVEYTYSNTSGLICTNSTSLNVQVNDLPQINFDANLANEYCTENNTLTINTQENPSGGTGEMRINGTITNQIDLNVPATYNIVYTYTENINNCTAEPIEKTIIVHPLPVVNSLVTSDGGKTEFCGTESDISLIANIQGVGDITAQSFNILQGGSVVLSNISTFSPRNLAVGNYTIQYFYTNPTTGCASAANLLDFTIIENEVEKRTIDEALCPDLFGFTLTADPAGENAALSYVWTNTNGEVIANTFTLELDQSATGQYIVEVFDTDACPVKSFTYNITIDCNTVFAFPNAFSPNNDGLNDVLEPLGQDFVKLDLRIYNRWGEVVFVGNDLNKQWDGFLNGEPVPAGTYIWKASYENILEPGKVYKRTGKVSVIR